MCRQSPEKEATKTIRKKEKKSEKERMGLSDSLTKHMRK
jgi:hypothetical protein